MPQLALSAGIVAVVFLGLVGLTLVIQMWTNRIDLQFLLSEKDEPTPREGFVQGQNVGVPLERNVGRSPRESEPASRASLSRFQFLIFTFIIGMCILVLTLDSGEFPKLDASVLGLLGISGTSYVVSKSIQQAGRKKDQ